ncbi:hypothetical protein [Methylosinus sp. Sm6]|uniref:hypothetical protein n=1 Tax=Methylosinus sp. Sm6 TaxID=2866948 RepID=UPI001C99B66A|nr:hypothetical protein [Methylosinus sp. Sm6]MBY6243883.1 hypothetical protein [Methylosinus sp. Sm6]
MKWLNGVNPYRDLPPEAACFMELLQKAFAAQADRITAEAAAMGVSEEDATASIMFCMIKYAVQYVAYDTIRVGELFPRAEFDALCGEIIGFVETRNKELRQ